METLIGTSRYQPEPVAGAKGARGKLPATDGAVHTRYYIWAKSAETMEGWQQTIIAEGIETAASAIILLNLPTAAVRAGNMASGLVLPAHIKSVVIAADHDRHQRPRRYPQHRSRCQPG